MGGQEDSTALTTPIQPQAPFSHLDKGPAQGGEVFSPGGAQGQESSNEMQCHQEKLKTQ